LIFSNAQAADAATYQLSASNSLGLVSSAPANLTVLPAQPSFILQPVSAAGFIGSAVTFQSLAIGSDDALDSLHYTWYFQGNRITGQTSSMLTLNPIAATNQGGYFVLVSNALGSATSAVAQLTVYQAPSLSVGLSNLVVEEGKTIQLSPSAIGTPPLTYSWNCNISPLQITNLTFTLSNITAAQAGFYSVTVSNQFGTVSSTGDVSVLLPSSQVVSWGDDSSGQTDVPTNLFDAVAVAGGDYHSVAIRHDGSLMAWGSDDAGQTDIPSNAVPIVAIAAGAEHNLAITEAGEVLAWGRDDAGQVDVPSNVSSVLGVAAGDSHSLVLLVSGTVVAWGDNTYGQTSIPDSLMPYYTNYWWGGAYLVFNPNWEPVKAITAGRNHNLALLTNGTVVAWGDNSFGQSSPPANLSNVVAVAAGYLHSVALCTDGSVVAWGDDTFGQTNVPSGLSNVVAIAAGDFHTLALCSNGRIVGWGDDTLGQLDLPPSAANVISVASGYYHGLALVPFLPSLQFQLGRDGLIFNWEGPGALQSAPTPSGPYTEVSNQGNSWTNADMSAPAKFFRLRQ
jgi:alpha-tubulin suppressor-like RCC1 family protein